MEKYYKFIFNKFFLLLFISFNYLSAQNTGSSQDFDGDGIINSVDIDDDNDGVLDILESPTNTVNTVTNPTFDTNTAGWNLSSAWTRYTNALAGRQDVVPTAASATQTGVVLKNACTNYAIYQLKIRTDNYVASSGAINTESMEFGAYLGGVRLFGVSNPANSTSPTITRDASANGIITQFWVDGVLINASSPKSITLLAYHDIEIAFNPAALPTTGTIEFRYTSTGDDVLIDDVYYYINSCPDTDNDGLPNAFDLDSDGDGCPDAVEAGTSAKAGTGHTSSGTIVNTPASGGVQNNIPNAIVGNGNSSDYGTNGFYTGIESNDTAAATYTGIYTYEYATNTSVETCKDTDGDGVPDFVDIDDDNDGVPDAVESPACYYTASEWNTGAKPTTNGVTISSALTTTTANFSQLIDGVSGTTAVAFSATPAQPIQNANVYLFNFAQPVKLDALYLKFTTSTQFSGSTKIQGSNTNNGTDWVDLSASVAAGGVTNVTANGSVSVATSVKYPVTLNTATAYKYIRITGVAASNIIAQNASEVYFDFTNASYVGSRYPKSTCTDANIDGDGILPHFDLDSDGDGCSDALESGATTITTTNYQFPDDDTNNDGLVDAVDADGDGVPNYMNTYSLATNATIKACLDTDGDGIRDIFDIDDDNDGVTDEVECAISNSGTGCDSYSQLHQYVKWNTYDSTKGLFTGTMQFPDRTITVTLQASNTTSAGISGANRIDSIPTKVCPTPTASNNTSANSPFLVSAGTYTVTFSEPMYQPNFHFWSLGSSAVHPTATFNTDIQYVSGNGIISTTEFVVDEVLDQVYSTAGKYAEGTGKILSGSITSFTFTTDISESNWSFFVSGIPTVTYIEMANCNIDTDNDLIPNRLDLDSDGDGCPDALEAGVSVNAGAFTSMSTSGGSIYTGGIPSGTANAYVGNGIPSQYGANGFYNGIETAADNGIYNGTYTYTQYALLLSRNVCLDSDGDNVPDIFDIDDDNDGVLDKIECPAGFFNLVNGGGFTTDPPKPNWYFANSSSNYDTPFVGFPFGYGGTQTNSTNTGGLFDQVDGNNTNTSGYNALIEVNGANDALVSTLNQSLVAGATYQFSYDAGLRGGSGTAGQNCTLQLYNADTNTVQSVLSSIPLNSLPAYPNYQTITGSFTVPTSGNYYLLFMNAGNGGAGNDYIIDRVAAIGTLGSNPSICDIDNDGISNYLDLDSDGDGCPDTKEAILYNHATEASIAGDVKNGSGGAVTTTVNTPNAMVPGPYGNNGFADALQSGSNPDAYKYVYSYLFVATDADVSTCDNKFLYDIDSDDDGTPDAIESPSCFYTEAQAMDVTEGVTSDFGWTTANPLTNTYDNITVATNYGEISAPTATSIQNKALITFDLPVIDAAFINSITLNVGLSFGAGKWKLQGLDMMTNTWTDLSSTTGQALGTGNIVFNNTLQNNTRYHSYRIIGVDNVNITNAARLIEFTIQYKNYNASYHRTKMGCVSDSDRDGVPNYLDRDSDGDGCPDAIEAGISKALLVPNNFFNTGGQVMGDYVTVGGNYGDNGLGDSVETAADSGIVNYTSTYTQYAINKTLNFCIDTDGDSVPDIIDLDDDNDGVLDTTECAYPPTTPTTSAADLNNGFAVWSNATTAAGTNLAPTYLASVGSWTAGNGLTAAISAGTINLSNVNASSLADAFDTNEYLEHPFTTTADNYNWLYYIRSSATNATNYNWAMFISDDDFVTYTVLNVNMLRNVAGNIVYDINDYQLRPSTAYKIRTYYWGATTLTFDDFTLFGYSECDADNDGIPNRLDLDSDGEGCPDAVEAGTAALAGAGNTSSGTVVNTSGTQTGVANAIVGNNTPAAYGANGFYTGIENNDTSTATYTGTYTYASAINAAISTCFCYKPAVTSGTVLDTNHGITSLQRAGSDNENWPMVRKGAWTALESKTKGFVPNRLTITQINAIPAANLREGMMVYNINSDCLYINTDGTATGWKCFNTQTCP